MATLATRIFVVEATKGDGKWEPILTSTAPQTANLIVTKLEKAMKLFGLSFRARVFPLTRRGADKNFYGEVTMKLIAWARAGEEWDPFTGADQQLPATHAPDALTRRRYKRVMVDAEPER